MTLEQLLSKESMMWFHKKNNEIKEGLKLSNDDIIEEYKVWFSENRDAINASILQEQNENNTDDENWDDDTESQSQHQETPDEGWGEDDTENAPKSQETPDEGWEDDDTESQSQHQETPDEGWGEDDDPNSIEHQEEGQDDDDIDDTVVEPEERIAGEGPDETEGLDFDGNRNTQRDVEDVLAGLGENENNPEQVTRYKLNNGKDGTRNVYSVVNTWYKWAKELGTNGDEVTALYFMDTSNVTNMTALFAFTNIPDLDLSTWDTSNVVHMEGMFYKSTFNNDSIVKNWNVSSCINFRNMFYGSKFGYKVEGVWTPGTVKEVVYDENSGQPMRDDQGNTIYRDVPAELPFIGQRVDDDQKKKEERVRQNLRGMDDQIKREIERREQLRASSQANAQQNEGYVNKNILSFESFVDEGFGDFLRKGVNKIKSYLKTITVKMNNLYCAMFSQNGNLLPVVSPYTSLNYIASGKVPGVQAFTSCKNDMLIPNAMSGKYVNDNNESYGFIKPGTNEMKNYEYFCGKLLEHYEKTGDMLFEGVMPLQSNGSGVGVEDITSKDLKDMLRKHIHNVPAYKKNGGKALCIFGAPGIGKSTIPKAIVKEFNDSIDSADGYKSVMVVNCGDLTLDGFYLPIPSYTKLSDIAKTHPKLYKTLTNSGVDIDRFQNTVVKQTMEAPKTWLPCYMATSDDEQNTLCNEIANGYLYENKVYDEEKKVWVEKQQETTEGGILLFDEFFRANSEIFKILMQIILERKTQGGMKIGDKWALVCCSNRPNDDDEVKLSRNSASPVLGNRFLEGAYNFIPEFDDWASWAEGQGILDIYTRAFLTNSSASDENTSRNDYEMEVFDKDKDENRVVKGYHRWHNVDPELWKKTDDKSVFMFPTPRTWTSLLEWIKEQKELNGVHSILSLKPGEIRQHARGVIGRKTADDYVDFLKVIKASGVSVVKIFKDPTYKVNPDTCDITTVTELIKGFVESKWGSSKEKFPTSNDCQYFINMFNFLKNSYEDEGVGGTYTLTLHSDIVRRILNISSTNNAKIKRLQGYLDLVIGDYGVKYSDQAI